MYFERFLETLTKAEIIIHEEAINTYTIHPIDIVNNKEKVLQEVSFSKEKMKAAAEKALVMFEQLVQKFSQMAFTLKKRNAKWFESVRNFDISKKNLKGFTHEMFNYKEGVMRLEKFTYPRFESINVNDLSGNGDIFLQNICKNHNIDTNNSKEESFMISKDYFRGGSEKIVIKEHEVRQLFDFAKSWLENYDKTARDIAVQSEEINKIKKMNKKETIVTESTILSESIFRDEYYDILLEDGVDPKDIEQEEKQEQKETQGIDVNPNESKENKENSEHNDAVETYWKICTKIQTMKMDVAQEAYKAFVDFIDKVIG